MFKEKSTIKSRIIVLTYVYYLSDFKKLKEASRREKMTQELIGPFLKLIIEWNKKHLVQLQSIK